RHILIRDVAYGTLARTERIRLHAKIAAWMEAANLARLDEYAGHIAYHYREAVMLARQSAVPLPLRDEPERAVRYLARVSELASRAGAMAEAASHLRSAIELAPQSDHTRLYELLGDTVLWGVWGDIPYTAYRSALAAWRRAGAADPLTGARLLRKMVG